MQRPEVAKKTQELSYEFLQFGGDIRYCGDAFHLDYDRSIQSQCRLRLEQALLGFIKGDIQSIRKCVRNEVRPKPNTPYELQTLVLHDVHMRIPATDVDDRQRCISPKCAALR